MASSALKDFWGNPPELKSQPDFKNGIAGIRCEVCGHLVEDYSDSGIRCKIHIDTEIVPNGGLYEPKLGGLKLD